MYGQVLASNMGLANMGSNDPFFSTPIPSPSNLEFMVANIPFFHSVHQEGGVNIGLIDQEQIMQQNKQQQSIQKKPYRRHTDRQIQEMEAVFKECPHPDKKLRKRLSQYLGLSPCQIRSWFQNHRTQLKTRQDRAYNGILMAENEKLKVVNVRVQSIIRNLVCPNCNGPAMLKGMSDEQHLGPENTRLKELEHLPRIPTDTSNRPAQMMGTAAPPFLHPSYVDMGMSIFPGTNLREKLPHDSNKRLAGVSKKRRLPKQDENMVEDPREQNAGQIVQYKPMMNDTAKAMLRQLLKAVSSSRLEAPNTSSDAFLIDNVPSTTEALNSGRNSGVTLTEVPFTSGLSYAPASSGFSNSSGLCAAISDTPSSLAAAHVATTSALAETVLTGVQPAPVSISGLPELQDPEGDGLDIPCDSFMSDVNGELVDPMPLGVDGSISTFLEDDNVDLEFGSEFWDQIDQYDQIWSHVSGEADENTVGTESEDAEVASVRVNGQRNTQNLAHITEHFSLLASDPKKS